MNKMLSSAAQAAPPKPSMGQSVTGAPPLRATFFSVRLGWLPMSGMRDITKPETSFDLLETIPYLIMPVFVLSLGFFITPALLGGGRVIMIAVLIEQQVRETLNWPFAAALSAVLLAATLAAYALAQRFGREEPAP